MVDINLTIKKGDIIKLYANDVRTLILQQNNCTALKLHDNSFAYNLDKGIPGGCNPYKMRERTMREAGVKPIFKNLAPQKVRPKMGTVQFIDRRKYGGPLIGCLFAQYKMGVPNSTFFCNSKHTDQEYLWMARKEDGPNHRYTAFVTCLRKILDMFKQRRMIEFYDRIVFPYKIGCNLAGGKWPEYKNAIAIFAKSLHQIVKNKDKSRDIRVFIIEK